MTWGGIAIGEPLAVAGLEESSAWSRYPLASSRNCNTCDAIQAESRPSSLASSAATRGAIAWLARASIAYCRANDISEHRR